MALKINLVLGIVLILVILVNLGLYVWDCYHPVMITGDKITLVIGKSA